MWVGLVVWFIASNKVGSDGKCRICICFELRFGLKVAVTGLVSRWGWGLWFVGCRIGVLIVVLSKVRDLVLCR